MSGEVIALLVVGVTLAGLIVTGQARIEARLAALDAIVGDLRERVTALEVRVANIEAVLGLRIGVGGPSEPARAETSRADDV